MINQQVIDSIKQGADLKGLMESRGIILKKNGKGYVGLCPFHDDKEPSLSVTLGDKNLWQCFGCGAAGDAIRFVEMFDQLSFRDAVEVLAESMGIQIADDDIEASDKTAAKGKTSKTTKAAKGKSTSSAKDSGKTSKTKPKAKPKAATKPTAASSSPLTIREKKLLARVVAYYQHTLGEDKRGLEYLTKDRGVADIRSLKDFGAGYANGTLLDILPRDEEVLQALRKIGVLNQRGHEFFFNCVVFPLYDANGSVTGLYGRHIDDNGESPRHLYLKGPMQGMVNRQAVQRSQTILLTESIIDALTLYDQGFKNAMPIYGTNGMTDELLSYLHKKVKEAYLVFDADDAGRKAMDAVSVRLRDKDITAHKVILPVKDVNIYFKRHTPGEFEDLLKNANPKSGEYSEKISKRKQSFYERTDAGFKVGFGDDRQYEIKGIQRGDTQLKATVKASGDLSAAHAPFELTTIDFYSSRSRLWFAKMCSELFCAVEELVKEDMGRLLALVEEFKPHMERSERPKPTQDEIKEALKFLKSPTMFQDILKDFETMGVTGEDVNKLVGYLAAVSRKLEDPLSVLVQSRSAAGKSTLQDAVLSLVPDEDYVKYTRVTDQALFYKDEDSLVHKILAIEEEEGMGGAAYSIRNIQSSKKITVAATGKDPGTGRMKTEEYTVKGPVCVMITTTAAELEGETASRFIFLTIDESPEMTKAIHKKQRESETLEGLVRRKQTEHIIRKHHTAQRMLKPLAVVNPFTQYLSYPISSIRTRRDHKKYLGLIRAVAFLHQHQRKIETVQVEGKPVEYIEVTLDDIEAANMLANEVLGQCLDELAPPSRTLLESIHTMVEEMTQDGKLPIDEIFFTRRMVREHTGWTDWQVKTHIKQLEELEYLQVRMGSRGKEYSYVLSYRGHMGNDPRERFYLNLTPVEEIRRLMNNGGKK